MVVERLKVALVCGSTSTCRRVRDASVDSVSWAFAIIVDHAEDELTKPERMRSRNASRAGVVSALTSCQRSPSSCSVILAPFQKSCSVSVWAVSCTRSCPIPGWIVFTNGTTSGHVERAERSTWAGTTASNVMRSGCSICRERPKVMTAALPSAVLCTFASAMRLAKPNVLVAPDRGPENHWSSHTKNGSTSKTLSRPVRRSVRSSVNVSKRSVKVTVDVLPVSASSLVVACSNRVPPTTHSDRDGSRGSMRNEDVLKTPWFVWNSRCTDEAVSRMR